MPHSNNSSRLIDDKSSSLPELRRDMLRANPEQDGFPDKADGRTRSDALRDRHSSASFC